MNLPTYDSHPTWRRYQPYFPEGMPAVGWYQPTGRGLEGKIKEKLDELRRLNDEATKKRK